jgi:glycosyltransferase involved in cell wall biosynthesis
MASAHVGLLASEFEGMPCFVLELLSVGRPLVSLDLPQLKLVVEDGVSGFIVPRQSDDDANALALAEALRRTRDALNNATMTPALIHTKIIPFSNAVQLQRLYGNHRRLRKGERRLVRTAPSIAN